jgi:hypothetical protein
VESALKRVREREANAREYMGVHVNTCEYTCRNRSTEFLRKKVIG